MIASANPSPRPEPRSDWQPGFRAMMPDIVKQATHAFRYFGAEAAGEAIQDVLVSAMLAYVGLWKRGKVDLAFPSVLARFAIAQYHDGRRAAAKLNCRDVSSPYAQRKKGIQVESIHSSEDDEQTWREILVEDKHAGPAETATARIDFAAWLASLTHRDRSIADALADGGTTNEVSARFQVSPARISQKRREFLDSWQRFQGDVDAQPKPPLPPCQ